MAKSYAKHNFNDFSIGVAHTLAGKSADVLNSVLYALGNDTVATEELTAEATHLISHNACLNRHGDLRGTGGLRTVADSA